MAKSKWAFGDVIRKGAQLEGLTLEHRGELEPRLGGVIDEFVANLGRLREQEGLAVAALWAKKGGHAGQKELAKECVALLMIYRKALKAAFPPGSPERALFGVGTKVDPAKRFTVASALYMLFEGAKTEPERARAAGILPEDVEKLQAAYDALGDKGEECAGRFIGSKCATSDRNACHLEVEAAMGRIVGVSGIVFHDRPEIAERFAECLPRTARPRRRKKKDDEQT